MFKTKLSNNQRI